VHLCVRSFVRVCLFVHVCELRVLYVPRVSDKVKQSTDNPVHCGVNVRNKCIARRLTNQLTCGCCQ
jgi:hypothetical protein